MIDLILRAWAGLGEWQPVYLALAIMGGTLFMVFGWMPAVDLDRRRRQIMALATLMLPITFALAPFFWAVLAMWKLGNLIQWLISAAAGEDPDAK